MFDLEVTKFLGFTTFRYLFLVIRLVVKFPTVYCSPLWSTGVGFLYCPTLETDSDLSFEGLGERDYRRRRKEGGNDGERGGDMLG